METIKQSSPIQNAVSTPNYGKLNNHLIKPLKAGFWGFTTILMIILFLNLFLLL